VANIAGELEYPFTVLGVGEHGAEDLQGIDGAPYINGDRLRGGNHVGGVTLHQPLFGGRGELGLEHGDRVEHGGGDADRYRGGGGGNAAQGAGHGVGEGGGAGGGGGEGDGAVAVVDYRTQ